jgi:lipopolysaccharide biosynthesis glycosyltransferase
MNPSNNSLIMIACAADEAFAMPMAVMLRSVLKNVAHDKQVCVFAVDGGIKESSKKKILASLGDKSESVIFNWIPAPESLPENLPIAKHVLPHINKSTYYRLLLPRILPPEIDKIIYLDSDLVVLGDLSKLWGIEISDNYVLASQDCGIPFVSEPYGIKKYEDLGISATQKYFNAGVLVMNIAKWRAEDIDVKLFKYLETYREHIQHHDQEAMNAVFAGKWAEISPQWNQTPLLFTYSSWKESPYKELDYSNAVNNPCIVHFASTAKPWNSFEKHPRRNLFFEYLDMTAWSGWRLNFRRRLQRKVIRTFKQFAV